MGLWERLFGSTLTLPGAETYGDYEVVEKIAQGRLSTLYRGAHVESGEEVAIKVLSNYACKVADKLTRKLHKDWEGSRALKLEHRHVVRTIEAVREHGRYHIVMEFLAGGTLSDLARSHAKGIQGRRIEIMRQAALGLEYIHAQGIIHRDISPRNVMLSSFSVAKLIDFGVAAERGDRIRNTGQRTGRPAYMAPELIRTNRFNDQTDVYAFGVSLYEVTTGQRPFKVRDTDPFRALSSILNAEPKRPSQLRPSISTRLEEVILTAMALEPKKRYHTMTEVVEALEGIDEGDL